jgi:hypothetical protein
MNMHPTDQKHPGTRRPHSKTTRVITITVMVLQGQASPEIQTEVSTKDD